MNWIYIFLGGGIGSLLRYGTSLLTKQFFSGIFPMGTLIANILSCVALALFLQTQSGQAPEASRLFVITGICGGFSTFSSFSLENVELARGGNWLMVGLNILVSVVVCFLIIYSLSKSQAS